MGINTGATIGYGHKTQITGNGGSISASRSNQNTSETINENGKFQNVNEVHNNTGTMILDGFNQEGGKVECTQNLGQIIWKLVFYLLKHSLRKVIWLWTRDGKSTEMNLKC